MPAHLRTEVAGFREWLGDRSEDDVNPLQAAQYGFDRLVDVTLAVRLTTWNSLAEYYGGYPWSKNPLPAPLMTRIVQPWTKMVAWVREKPLPDRAWLSLALFGHASKAEIERYRHRREGFMTFDSRITPITSETNQWLQNYSAPSPAQLRSALDPFALTDLHGSLIAELLRRNVSEPIQFAVYGRYSAQKARAPLGKVGLFRWIPKSPT